MSHAKVILGHTARSSVQNIGRLEKRAVAVASAIAMPAGIEFARFTHAGKVYALSARMLVEVELLDNRVPDVVIRTGQRAAVPRRP
jgi:hypothetical protein